MYAWSCLHLPFSVDENWVEWDELLALWAFMELIAYLAQYNGDEMQFRFA